MTTPRDGPPSLDGPLSKARTRLVRRLSDRKGRAREARVLIEGPRAVETALAAGASLEFAVFEGDVEGATSPVHGSLQEGLARAGVERFCVAPSGFAAIADTENPQGVLAVAVEPPGELPEWLPSRALVLDRVQDPGNVGTLIRSAAAMGVELVVALDGTVDPWNPKVVRAAAGECFRVRVARSDWPRFDAWRTRYELPLLVADGAGVDVRGTISDGASRCWALLIGNEGAGPRAEALEAATRVVALPLAGGVESLNAAMAGSILLWALGPQSESLPESPP